MVEDAPPYWQYIPRNLSYTSQESYHGRSTHSGQLKDRCINKMSLRSSEEEDAINELNGDLGSTSEFEKDTTNCVDGLGDLTLEEHSRSDYGSDISTSSSVETFKVTCSDDDLDIKVIVSSDEPSDSDSGTESSAHKGKILDGFLKAKSKNVTKGEKLSLYQIHHEDFAKSFFDLLGDGDDDPDFLNVDKGELRRSTSLKTTKTPPDTPRRKKVVRFADAFGLDLENVRHILNLDDPPKIPQSAMADLKKGIESEKTKEGSVYLQAQFSQPGANGIFIQRVNTQKVSLENSMINGLTITGTIRVANISFHKTVRIRYSVNGWTTFTDALASYVHNSCDGATDRFSFTVVAPMDFIVGNKLEFAVGFEAENQSFWDNNFGQNYVFECYARSVPTSSTEHTWLQFL